MCFICWGLDSSVDWATEGSGFDIRQTYRFPPTPPHPRTTFGPTLRQTDPPVQGVLGTPTPGGKLRTFLRLRMCRAVLTLARTVVFMLWVLIKIDATFTFNQGRPETRGLPGQVNNLAPREG